jgi:hypothetical protein
MQTLSNRDNSTLTTFKNGFLLVPGSTQGHSDFLIKVHGFPDLLSWSFPGGVSGL